MTYRTGWRRIVLFLIDLVLVILASIVLVAVARADSCIDMFCATTTTTTTNTPTVRVCARGFIVEIGPEGWLPDESLVYTEGRDIACHDVQAGETVEILEWTPELGHSGRVVRVTPLSLSEFPVIDMAQPSCGECILEEVQGYDYRKFSSESGNQNTNVYSLGTGDDTNPRGDRREDSRHSAGSNRDHRNKLGDGPLLGSKRNLRAV